MLDPPHRFWRYASARSRLLDDLVVYVPVADEARDQVSDLFPAGADPELNELGQSNFSTDDFLTQPPVRYWTFRVNYSF